jgi:hypothetical protein
MSSDTTVTVLKMIESLPEPVQERVLEHLQDYIEDVRDEMQWGDSFARSKDKLVAAAKKARKELPKVWPRRSCLRNYELDEYERFFA